MRKKLKMGQNKVGWLQIISMTLQQSLYPHANFWSPQNFVQYTDFSLQFCGTCDPILATGKCHLGGGPSCTAGMGTGPNFSCSLGCPFPTRSCVFCPVPADVLIAFCIQDTHPNHLHENMVPVTGTERSRMFQSLVLPLQSGISVK